MSAPLLETMSKPPIRAMVKPLAHRREPLAVRANCQPEVASAGVHADCESILSRRASNVLERSRRIARCTPSEETKQKWSEMAAHSRSRFAKRPDFKQPSLLREGLIQLQTGCVSRAVETLRQANPRAPSVRAALTKAEAMLADLGNVATVGQVAKWEWVYNAKARLTKLSAGLEDALGDEESEWLKNESVQSWKIPGLSGEENQKQSQSTLANASDSAATQVTVSSAVPAKDITERDDEDEPASPVFSEGDSPGVAAKAREFGFLPPRRQNEVSELRHASSPWPAIKRAAGRTPQISLPVLTAGRRCRSAQEADSTPSSQASPVWERLFNSEKPDDAAVAQYRTGWRRGDTKPKAKKKLESRFGEKPASAPAVTVPQAQHSVYEAGLLSETDVKQGRRHRRKAATPITAASAWQPGEDCPVVERNGKPRVRDRRVSSDPPMLRAALAEAAELEKKSRGVATCQTNGKLRKRSVYGSEL